MSSAVFSIQEHTISAQHIREYPGATLQSQDDELKLHVKQYIPRGQTEPPPGAISIIGAHANGFPKVCVHFLFCFSQLMRGGCLVSKISAVGAL